MDDTIFLLAKNGNKDAIELVIKTVEPFIFKQCRRMRLREFDYEDLCQIGYMAVIKGIPKINADHLSTAPSYLMKCVHNALKYEARRVLSRPEDASLETEDKDGIKYAEKLVSDDDTEELFFNNHDRTKIKEAFDILCTEEKNVISYYISDPYGGLKRYSDLYKTDYRKSRYLKDKALKKMRIYLNQDEYFVSHFP
jgi:RNA polymerase sigma factor (sigma-70 family)